MQFYKYQGTGNDFIMIDDRSNAFDIANTALVKHLCDRKFGIGADGLILLRLCNTADFEMVYYNSDGNLSSMCGNGGRCIARFAQQLGLVQDHCTFLAVDGMHEAHLNKELVSLKMKDVVQVEKATDFLFLNTGSPHVVKYCNDLEHLNIVAEGRSIRYNQRFEAEGTNVNFIHTDPETNIIHIRTYERGVEDETLSCGTGITAAAIADVYQNTQQAGDYSINLNAQGGNLNVKFHYNGHSGFTEVYLTGPAELVFEGQVN